MVATTQVRFLVGANYGVDFKKIPSSVKPGFGGFSKSGEGLFFLMKTVRRYYPAGLVFLSKKKYCSSSVLEMNYRIGGCTVQISTAACYGVATL
jgi:hypothetical protein